MVAAHTTRQAAVTAVTQAVTQLPSPRPLTQEAGGLAASVRLLLHLLLHTGASTATDNVTDSLEDKDVLTILSRKIPVVHVIHLIETRVLALMLLRPERKERIVLLSFIQEKLNG